MESQLVKLPKLQEVFGENTDSQQSFERFLHIADIIANYLRTVEGIETASIYPAEVDKIKAKWNSLTNEQRQEKMETFSSFYTICSEIIEKDGGLSDKPAALKRFFSRFGLRVAGETRVFEILDKDTYFEVYNKHFVQVFRSVDFLRVTGHSIVALQTLEWWELFHRSPDVVKKQLELVTHMFSGGIQDPIFNPIEPNTVKELNSSKPHSAQTESTVYAPIFDAQGQLRGGLHFFKILDVRPLDFSILN